MVLLYFRSISTNFVDFGPRVNFGNLLVFSANFLGLFGALGEFLCRKTDLFLSKFEFLAILELKFLLAFLTVIFS